MDIDNFLILTNPLIPTVSSYIHQIETNSHSQSIHSLPYEVHISIRHPKVVQKSYKNEKRFFCPSPSLKISGSGWQMWQHGFLSTEQLTNQNGASSNVKPIVKVFPQCVALVDNWPDYGHSTHLKFDYASFKSLFFSDKDKRKIFQLETKIFLSPNISLGIFLSNPIRVISKPSKKKQTGTKPDKHSIPSTNSCSQGSQNSSTFQQPSSSSTDSVPFSQDPACISSGSEICIFNRGRSQAIATKYLSTNQNGAFEASVNFWEIFTIDLVDNKLSDESLEFETRDGYIFYGCHARLTSEKGITLPTLKLERIEKQRLAVSSDNEPLGQLQKLAFQVVSTGQYLAFVDSEIVQVPVVTKDRTLPDSATFNVVTTDRTLPDSATFNVVTVEEAMYTFHPLLYNILSPIIAIGPCPTVLQIGTTFTQGQCLFLEIIGSNFSPNLLVFFSTIPTVTFYRSSELIFCLVPSYKEFLSSIGTMEMFDIPLYLWRKDGILFETGQKFVYCLLEHLAIEERNQDYSHSSVSRQPDQFEEFEFKRNQFALGGFGYGSGANCVASAVPFLPNPDSQMSVTFPTQSSPNTFQNAPQMPPDTHFKLSTGEDSSSSN